MGGLVVREHSRDECIRSTLWGNRQGYDATFVNDAHTTEDQSEWGAPRLTKSLPTRIFTGGTTLPPEAAERPSDRFLDFAGGRG